MTGPKLNEAPVIRRRPESRAQAVTAELPSTRAVARHMHVSPYKVREVLDLIRGHEVQRALDILRLCERDAAIVVGKLLASAMANAEHNHALVTDELFVSACYADEGPTLKRWRPRARGRATRIRKRTCHVTVIVSRLPEAELRAAAGPAGPGHLRAPRRRPSHPRHRRRRTSRPGRHRPRPSPRRVEHEHQRFHDARHQGRRHRFFLHTATTPGPQTAEPKAQATEPEVPTTMAENDDNAPQAEAITERPEVRDEGPASGDAANEATEADVSEDDSSSDDAEDKE